MLIDLDMIQLAYEEAALQKAVFEKRADAAIRERNYWQARANALEHVLNVERRLKPKETEG